MSPTRHYEKKKEIMKKRFEALNPNAAQRPLPGNPRSVALEIELLFSSPKHMEILLANISQRDFCLQLKNSPCTTTLAS